VANIYFYLKYIYYIILDMQNYNILYNNQTGRIIMANNMHNKCRNRSISPVLNRNPKQNILNHFNTRKGQRVMNPTFGTIIWDILMEPLTPQIRNVLTKDIETICNTDPRVYPTQIQVNEYEQGYLIDIVLVMKNTDQSSALKLVFDQKVGLVLQ
jgi:phage baseplate assembly protein W